MNLTQTDKNVIATAAAEVIAGVLVDNRSQIQRSVTLATERSGVDNPAQVTKQVDSTVSAMVTQDSPLKSKRLWALVAAVVTAVLSVPEVAELLGTWTPMVTALVAASLAAWSKAIDPRPFS